MKITGTKDFEDFCKQNNFTNIEGLRALEKELEKKQNNIQ